MAENMAENRKENVLNRVSRIIAEEMTGSEIFSVLKYLCGEFKLDIALMMNAGDIPLFLEMGEYWERKPMIAGRHIVLDYREKPDWQIMNPYLSEKKGTIINDVSTLKGNSVTKEFFKSIGGKAFIICPIIDEYDYIGISVFGCENVREWEDEEEEILMRVTRLFYKSALLIKRQKMYSYLTEESLNVIQRIQNSRNDYISGISKEIRTPVNAIIGMISILHHNMENQDVISQCVERLEKTSKQLLDSLNSCLSESVQGGKVETLERTRFVLSDLIEDGIRALEPLAKGRKQKIVVEADENCSIFADREKLAGILNLLVSNACKFSSEGGRIKISAYVSNSGNATVMVLKIEDNGVGIDQDVLDHMFDPVQNAYNAARDTGISMSMTLIKHLVDMMYGTIDISSEKGKGTSIAVTIPVESVVRRIESTEDTEQEEESESNEVYIGRRILIAEDNVMMAEILATLLGYRGLETDVARNGEEAVSMYNSHEQFYYDMIFMDIQMPIKNGIEAAKAIRASKNADAGMIPIVALSAGGFEEDVQRSIDAGMNAHLTKPVGEKELFDIIATYMI